MNRSAKPVSARARILGAVLAVACAGLLVAGGVTFWVQQAEVHRNVDAQLHGFVNTVTLQLSGSSGEDASEIVTGAVAGRTDATIALRGGEVIAASPPSSGIDLARDSRFIAALSASVPDGIKYGEARGDRSTLRYVAVPFGDATIVHAVDLDERMELVDIGVASYAIAGVVVLAAIGVVGWFVTGTLLTPLRHLRDRADSITIADLGARIPAEGNDEISDLTRTVNSMLERLEASLDVQRQLLDDVRHELKTPITIVRGHLEMMDAADPADVDTARQIGIAELDRMTRLVDDIDLLATVERGALTFGVVDVDALTHRVGEMVAVIPGHVWTVEQRARVRVDGDYDRLLQAWLQLADNAAKYTPEGSPIEIGSSADESGVQLWVRDHGPGIPPAARHRIFRRFDRAQGRRAVGGSGLGLAIVDAIAKGHQGRCSVVDTPGGGAMFIMHIPLSCGAAATDVPAPVSAGDVVLQREAAG